MMVVSRCKGVRKEPQEAGFRRGEEAESSNTTDTPLLLRLDDR